MTIKDKLPADSPLDFGSAPIGNMIRAIPDDEAIATVRAARERGSAASTPCRRPRSYYSATPADFWRELKNQELVNPAAPLRTKDPS